MKKVISILLSVLMLLSITSGMEFSAFAEESLKLTIGSTVKDADAKVSFKYEIKVNDALYNGVAVDEENVKYNVTNGIVSIPTTKKASITIEPNSSYSVKRLAFSATGYEAIAESEAVTGKADGYDYFETIGEGSPKSITAEEYNSAIVNGFEFKPGVVIVDCFVEKETNERLYSSEVEHDDFYELTGEEPVDVGYKGTAKTHSPTIKVTTKLNEQPSIITGKTKYYYDGKISCDFGSKQYVENYKLDKLAVPGSQDKASAKKNAEIAVKAQIKSFLLQAINDFTKDKKTSVFLTESFENLYPKADCFDEKITDHNIFNKSTTLFEFVPYYRQQILYEKKSNGGVNAVNFEAELIKKHVHSYKTQVVAPTCVKKGYTRHYCSCGDEYKDNYKDVVAHKYNTVTTPATTKRNGVITKTCTVCRKKLETYIPYAKTISLSKTAYTYNKKVQKPSVTIKDAKGNKLKLNTDYTVKYSSGCKKIGEYTVTATLKGKYKGELKATYRINPKGTSLTKVTGISKGFTAKWKKQSSQTKGYQIQYSTDKNFKKNTKSVTILKNSTTSKNVTKLSSKKTYYVRIRTYSSINGTRFYSDWSKAVKVKTKK